jgi:UDP-sugar pyrophosphorylase
VNRAKRALTADAGSLGFDNYNVEIPTGVELNTGDELMFDMEAIGMREMEKVGFVLVAGGMGERLGYSNIKVSLPVCIIEEDYTFIKYFCSFIMAC